MRRSRLSLSLCVQTFLNLALKLRMPSNQSTDLEGTPDSYCPALRRQRVSSCLAPEYRHPPKQLHLDRRCQGWSKRKRLSGVTRRSTSTAAHRPWNSHVSTRRQVISKRALGHEKPRRKDDSRSKMTSFCYSRQWISTGK